MIKLHEDSFQGYMTEPPESTVSTNKDEMMWMYDQMVSWRLDNLAIRDVMLETEAPLA